MQSGKLPLAATLFFLALLLPIMIRLGPIRLTPYRLVLLAMVVPCLAQWLSGRLGRKLLADWCVLGICAWTTLSFAVHHGAAMAVESGGINFIEAAGAWFLARATIRTPEAFHALAMLLFLIVILLLPLAIIESVTGRNIVAMAFGGVEGSGGQRFGLNRARGPFDHAILFGVFCGATLGLTYYVLGYGRATVRRMGQAILVFCTAAFALSAGPLVALTSQSSLVAWDKITSNLRSRWQLLAILAIIAYILVDLLSTRSPIRVFLHYFSFSPHTAYARLLIWEFGTENIWANPLFGLGMNDWTRPSWMGDSVDMFWIAPAMRHGVPVWFLYFLLFFSVTAAVARRRGLDDRLSAYRMGYIASMAGLFLTGWAVHFWNASFVYFFFMLGSGAWLIDARPEQAPRPRAPDETRPRTFL